MHHIVIALALGIGLIAATPVLAGPNGTSPAPFFPLIHPRHEPRDEPPPYALLGDVERESGTRTPAAAGERPARGWLRRPSEGK